MGHVVAPRRRAVAAILVILAAAAGWRAGGPHAVLAAAPAGPTPMMVDVQGGPIGGISVSPVGLAPAFSPATQDYVVPCASGANSLSLGISATPGHTVAYGSRAHASVIAAVTMVEGQSVVVRSDAGGAGEQYWIRCLPHDFPTLRASRPGSPSPGWYLTGTIRAAAGSSFYAMILDTNGTPVWYAPAPGGAEDVQAIDASTLSYSPVLDAFHANAGIGIVPLDGSDGSAVSAAGVPTDGHEMLRLPNGDVAVLAYPLKTGVDLSATGDGGNHGTNQTIADCEVQELDPQGNVVWQWLASDHVGMDESRHPNALTVDGTVVWDVFHCNAVDEDAGGNIMVSFRHADAVFDISRASKSVVWKLGGTASNRDGAQVLTVVGDPAQGFSGQHDARFLGGGDISLYDDETFTSGPTSVARGVTYHIDLPSGTATLVWQYATPLGVHAAATGSFRRYADGSNVVGWGFLSGAGFTDVDQGGSVQLDVGLPGGDAIYRAVKVPVSAFDIGVLRRTAGRNSQADPVVQPPPTQPTVGYWLAGADGGVFPFGQAIGYGSLGAVRLNRPVAGMAATPDDGGYWLVASDGGVFPFGDAGGYGSTGGVRLNAPMVNLTPTPDGGGYWLVATDGGVFPFGDAGGYGSTGNVRLNASIVAAAAAPDGAGYWLAAADGGIFPFGSAVGYGSLGGVHLNKAIVAMAATADGGGYWLAAADGGVFPFGDAVGYGSMGNLTLNRPVVGLATTPDGGGYWLVASDGGVFPFGDAGGYGSAATLRLNAPMVGATA